MGAQLLMKIFPEKRDFLRGGKENFSRKKRDFRGIESVNKNLRERIETYEGEDFFKAFTCEQKSRFIFRPQKNFFQKIFIIFQELLCRGNVSLK